MKNHMMASAFQRLKGSFVPGVLHRALGYAVYNRPIRTRAILNFHSIREVDRLETFHYARNLAVSPSFLEGLIIDLRRRDIPIVSLTEALERLTIGDPDAFVAITFDDGYADNFST